jgi:hypothetical protein
MWASALSSGFNPKYVKDWVKLNLEKLHNCISDHPPICRLEQTSLHHPLDPILLVIIKAIETQYQSYGDNDKNSLKSISHTLDISLSTGSTNKETLKLLSQLVSLVGMKHLLINAPSEYVDLIFPLGFRLSHPLISLSVQFKKSSVVQAELGTDVISRLVQHEQILSIEYLYLKGLSVTEWTSIVQLMNKPIFPALKRICFDDWDKETKLLTHFKGLESIGIWGPIDETTRKALEKYIISKTCQLHDFSFDGKLPDATLMSLGYCQSLRSLHLLQVDAFDCVSMISTLRIPLESLAVSDDSEKPLEMIAHLQQIKSLKKFQIRCNHLRDNLCSCDEYLNMILPGTSSFHPGISCYEGYIYKQLQHIYTILQTNTSLVQLRLFYRNGFKMTAESVEIFMDGLLNALNQNRKRLVDLDVGLNRDDTTYKERIAPKINQNVIHRDYWSQLCLMVAFLRANHKHPFQFSVIPLVHTLMKFLGRIIRKNTNRPKKIKNQLHTSILDTKYVHALLAQAQPNMNEVLVHPASTAQQSTPPPKYNLRDRKRKAQ